MVLSSNFQFVLSGKQGNHFIKPAFIRPSPRFCLFKILLTKVFNSLSTKSQIIHFNFNNNLKNFESIWSKKYWLKSRGRNKRHSIFTSFKVSLSLSLLFSLRCVLRVIHYFVIEQKRNLHTLFIQRQFGPHLPKL